MGSSFVIEEDKNEINDSRFHLKLEKVKLKFYYWEINKINLH